MARTPEIEAAAKLAEEFALSKQYGGFKGKKNVYTCLSNSTHRMVTVDREHGVTPFMTGCPACEALLQMYGIPRVAMNHGMMQSACYRVPQNLPATYEWYRPDTLDGLNEGSKEHVLKGGLLLRPIKS